MSAAHYMRAKLLRYVSPPRPGVRMDQVWEDGHPISVLRVVATSGIRAKLDGRPVADIDERLFLYDGRHLVCHRVAGVLVAAIYAEEGMLVQSGRHHYVIANGELAEIGKAAHDYLLGLRRTAAATKSAAKPMARAAGTLTSPTTNAPGGAA